MTRSDRPQLIGLPTRIRLVEVIGSGAFSVVWRARDSQSGRDLAVKILPLQSSDAHAAGRLEREARALSRLNQIEGTVLLHQVGMAADGTAWLLLDFAPGGSLRDCIAARANELALPGVSAAVDLEVGEELAANLFSTLAGAHACGVIHGDISPANVLFGESGEPLLADFGMAALLGGGDGAAGVSGFTPAYGAPERLRGGNPDRPSDVFALAATLWHAEFGQLPQVASPGLSLPDPLQTGADPTVVRQGAPAVRQEDWMMGALSLSPADRPDAATVAKALKRSRLGQKGRRLGWKYPRRDVE